MRLDEMTEEQKVLLKELLESTQIVQLVFDPKVWPNPLDGFSEMTQVIGILPVDAIYLTRKQAEREHGSDG